MANRLIAYGDLHGCLEELKELRANLNIDKDDIEVSLGDIINKGPYSIELIKYLKANNIAAVIGNHEYKFLRYKQFVKSKESKNQAILSNAQKDLFSKLDKECFDYLYSMQPFLKFGIVTLVHGGLLNSIRLDKLSKKEKNMLMHIRWVDKNDKFVSLDGIKNKNVVFWSTLYNGLEGFVVYGHQPFLEPKKDRFSLGIDTGCVYGNKLTAAVFKQNSGVVNDLQYETHSVPAKKTYDKKAEFGTKDKL